MAFPDFLRRPPPPEAAAVSVEAPARRLFWQPSSVTPVDLLPWKRRQPPPFPPDPIPDPVPVRWRFRFSNAEPDGPEQMAWRVKPAPPEIPEPAPLTPRANWHPGYFTAEPTGPDTLAWRRQPAPVPEIEATTVVVPRYLPGKFTAEPTGPDGLAWRRRGPPGDDPKPPAEAMAASFRLFLVPVLPADMLAWRRVVLPPEPSFAAEVAVPVLRGRPWASTQLPVPVPGPFFFEAMDVWAGGFEQGDLKEG